MDKENAKYQIAVRLECRMSLSQERDQPAIASVAPPPAMPIGSISRSPPTQTAVQTTKAPRLTETDSADEVSPVVPDESPR